MSYLVLARKSRPSTFHEVVGQKPIVRTLQNALSQNRVAHALIFSGVRGVGKTTLARIMAKALNCEQGPATEPCDKCQSCNDIKSGASVDLVEIDGASNRGIQEIRELKENIRFMPTGSRYKIIIIDEVHMLTTEAFNALLKTLEEPPDHVYFMFATTELHRVPVTILSRCQRYELKRIGSKELTAHFDSIARSENVEIEPSALSLIVREAGGSVRDGLSLLDQVFSYCGNKVSAEDLVDVLGLVSHRVIADMSKALLSGDMSTVLQVIDEICSYGMDLKRFINDLLSWFRALVICSVSDSSEDILDLTEDEAKELQDIVSGYPDHLLVLMFNILMENLEKTGFSTRPRFSLELALIKAVQARDVVPVTAVLGRLDDVLEGKHSVPVLQAEQKEGAAKEIPSSQPMQKKRIVSSDDSASEQVEKCDDEKVVFADTETGMPEISKTVAPVEKISSGGPEKNKSKPLVAGHSVVDQETFSKTVRQKWQEFIEYVRDRKPWMASALQMASSTHFSDGTLFIEYVDSAGCRMLKNREHITPLTEFATDYFQKSFIIKFTVPDSSECETDSVNGNKVQKERQALANDALVLTAVDIFNGEVGDIRVGPRFRKPISEPGQNTGEDKPAKS